VRDVRRQTGNRRNCGGQADQEELSLVGQERLCLDSTSCKGGWVGLVLVPTFPVPLECCVRALPQAVLTSKTDIRGAAEYIAHAHILPSCIAR